MGFFYVAGWQKSTSYQHINVSFCMVEDSDVNMNFSKSLKKTIQKDLKLQPYITF